MMVVSRWLLSLAVVVRLVAQKPSFLPDQPWQLLAENYQLTADSAVSKDGSVYFTDSRNDRILKLDPQGNLSTWKTGTGEAHGIVFGPDGRLYAGQHNRKRVVAFGPDGTETVLAEGVQTHHLTVTARNRVYFTESPKHLIRVLDPGTSPRIAYSKVDWPKSLHPSPDQSRLFVTDPHTPTVLAFRFNPDGTLTDPKPACTLNAPANHDDNDSGMTFDTSGNLYVATPSGIQICDTRGQVFATVPAPRPAEGVTDVFFAGPNLQWLYVADGTNIYRRLSSQRGAPTWAAVNSSR